MTATNNITGDEIKTKANSSAYQNGWERIFERKRELEEEEINKSYAVDVENNFKPFLAEDIPLNVLGED